MASVPTGGPRLAAYLKNPGLRGQLPTKDLSPAQRAARAWIAKTKTPITPGSSITQSQLASQAKSAVAEKYGPATQQANSNLLAAQQFAQKQGDWYQQYQAAAKANQDAVAAAGTRANAEIQALQGATTGLAGQSPGQNQTSTDAAGVRAALLASMGGLVSGQSHNANVAASGQANIVAPGQAIQGGKSAQGIVQKALGDLSTLAGEKGAYAQNVKDTTLSNEERNILARQTLGVNATKVTNAADAAAARNTTAQDRIAQQNKQFAEKTHPGTDVSNGAWATWGKSPGGLLKRKQALADHQALTHPPKTPKTIVPRTGPGSLTQPEENKLVNDVQNAEAAARRLLGVKSRGDDQLRSILGTKYDAWAVNVALDLVKNGYLSQRSIDVLHSKGVHAKGHFALTPPKKPVAPPSSGSAPIKTSTDPLSPTYSPGLS